MFGPPFSNFKTCSLHHSNSSKLSPFQAKTGTPVFAIAAATLSCVEKILQEHQRTYIYNNTMHLRATFHESLN
ncbi:hypothetical protein MXB_4720 [Myxobolus squamalis]|nr:hypothetical protein MXB_4720 [Myxobolus squamalis]